MTSAVRKRAWYDRPWFARARNRFVNLLGDTSAMSAQDLSPEIPHAGQAGVSARKGPSAAATPPGRKSAAATAIASLGPLPRGLTGWLARIADRASNSADRRDLPFHEAIDALFPPDSAESAPLLLADLHSDTLLWGIDPWARRSGGHMDIPRLIDARVGLQVFGGPTWTPLPMTNREQALCVSCESIDQSDALFPSQWLDRLRREKGGLRRRRAHKLAARFHEMLGDDHDGLLRPVYQASDLDGLATGREAGTRRAPIGVMLSLEGVHWIEPETPAEAVRAEMAALRAAGYRMIAPTHRFSNGLGGASEDCSGRMGLTAAGRSALQACFELGIGIDLAHAAPAMIREAAGLALMQPGGAKPLIVSHAGVRGANRVSRNLRDADIRAVASTGGLIGVGVWLEAIGFQPDASFEDKIARVVDAFAAALKALRDPEFVEEMQDRYGHYDPYEHLAIGSDFDGATYTPFDVTGLSWLLAALAKKRDGDARDKDAPPMFPPEKLRMIAGENTRRVLKKALD